MLWQVLLLLHLIPVASLGRGLSEEYTTNIKGRQPAPMQFSAIEWIKLRLAVAKAKEYFSSALFISQSSAANISSDCKAALNYSYESNMTMRFLDAQFHLPAGVSQGALMWFGDWDTCVLIDTGEISASAASKRFTGSYCNVPVVLGPKPNFMHEQGQNVLDNALTLSVCVPSLCDERDITAAAVGIAQLAASVGITQFQNLSVWEDLIVCETVARPYTTTSYAAYTFVGVIVSLLILATVYDLYLGHCQCIDLLDVPTSSIYTVINEPSSSSDISQPTTVTVKDNRPILANSPDPEENVEKPFAMRAILTFSLYSNGKALLAREKADNPLSCLHGIRIFSLLWIILAHSYVYKLSVSDNVFTALTYAKRFSFQIVLSAEFAVDTFYVMSGLLVSYHTLTRLSRGISSWGKFFATFYVYRYIRLTPIYGIVIFIYTGISPVLLNGPVWRQQPDPACVSNWWANLLYVNNVINSDQMCIPWSWYLSTEMQFYVFSPIFILAFYWKAVAGWVLTLGAVFAHMLITGTISHVNDLPAATGVPPISLSPNATAPPDWFDLIYIKPWCRLGPYVMGIALGYVIFQTQGKTRLPRKLHFATWLIVGALAGVLVWGLYPVYHGDIVLSREMNAFYNSGYHIWWGVVAVWLIYSCSHGCVPLNSFFSFKGFVPLSRLTYVAYLVHCIVIGVYVFAQRRAIHFFDVTDIWIYVGCTTMSFIVATAFSLAFEGPALALNRLIFTR